MNWSASVISTLRGIGGTFDGRDVSPCVLLRVVVPDRMTNVSIDAVRTPEERFAGLVDFPYEPRFADVDGLRMAYVEAGSGDRGTFLLLHGEPTWGYLYRRMIPPLVDGGFRVVVPDLIGFGRSDKPTDRAAYTYDGHVGWLTSFVEALERPSAGFSVFVQDWGGLLGLRMIAEHPEWFDRVVVGNTALPTGEPMGDGFMMWRRASQDMEFMDCGRLLGNAVLSRELSEGEMDAYRAPFPDESYMAGARQFPLLVPIAPDDAGVSANRAAWQVWEQWTKPVLTLWTPGDIVLGHLQSTFVDRIPGAAGQPHATFEPGGHFLQDDRGEDVAAAILAWMP
jgi:haloalkane dehalogenase